MPRMLVGLEEVLARLRDQGPLPTSTISSEFKLNPLDARILMLHAHVSGLVVRNDWGEWAITDEGLEAIGFGTTQPSQDHPRIRKAGWRISWQRGALVAVCAAACLAVAVAVGGFGSSSSRPTEPSRSRVVGPPRAARIEARIDAASQTTHTVVTPGRHVERRLVTAGGARARAKPSLLPRSRARIIDVLAGEGVGGVRFGASPAAVRVTLDALMGANGGAYFQRNGCGIDHEIDWPSRSTGAAPDRVPVLSVFFKRGRFVGYQYGEYGSPTKPRYSRRAVGLASVRGLRIGESLALAYRLYGRAFTISASQGGTWSAATVRGQLRGFAWGTTKHGKVGSQSLIDTIGAGDLGCPALSP